jgi:DNA-binding XRE family transcriptional regulator
MKKMTKKMATKKKNTNLLKTFRVGEFFAAYRANREVTQRDLAKKLNCKGPYIAQVEGEKFEVPIQVCRKLSKHLDERERAHLNKILRATIRIS